MPEELSIKLKEIEKLLLEEREALRKLDTPTIEAIAARKLALAQSLSDAKKDKAQTSSEDTALLVRIRELATSNQILMVHARTCIRGAIEAVTGQSLDGYPKLRPSTPIATMSSLRMDVRG